MDHQHLNFNWIERIKKLQVHNHNALSFSNLLSNRYSILFMWISNTPWIRRILETPKAAIVNFAINLKCIRVSPKLISHYYGVHTHANIAADLFTLHYRRCIVHIEFNSHQFTICLPLSIPFFKFKITQRKWRKQRTPKNFHKRLSCYFEHLLVLLGVPIEYKVWAWTRV